MPVTGNNRQTLRMRRQPPVATKAQNLPLRTQNTPIEVSITGQPPRISHRNRPLTNNLGPGRAIVGIKCHRHNDGRATPMPRTRRACPAPHQHHQCISHASLIRIATVTTQHVRPFGMVPLPCLIGEAHQCGTQLGAFYRPQHGPHAHHCIISSEEPHTPACPLTGRQRPTMVSVQPQHHCLASQLLRRTLPSAVQQRHRPFRGSHRPQRPYMLR